MIHRFLRIAAFAFPVIIAAFVVGCSKDPESKRDPQPPPAPTGLQLTDTRTDAFIANWEAVDGADGYILFVAKDENFTQLVPGFNPKAVFGTRDTVRGLTADTRYYVKLIAARESTTGTPVFGDTRTNINDVYITGWDNTVGSTTSSITAWMNGTPTRLFGENGESVGGAAAIFVSGYDVYVAGYIGSTLPSNLAHYWKNGVPVKLTQGTASGITVIGNDVYVSGTEGFGANSHAGYWKNGLWTGLGNPSFMSVAAAMVADGNDIYIAGHEADGTHMIPKYWKNGVETILPSEPNTDTHINAIFVKGDDVYAAGSEWDGAVTKAVYWKNGVYTSLSNVSSNVRGIWVDGNDIYIAGFESVGPVSTAKYWKNGEIVELPAGTTMAEAIAITVQNGNVHVVGTEFNNGTEAVRYWENNTLDGSILLTTNGYGNSILVR